MDSSIRNNNLDDPCCTFLIHGVCGVWGLLATGIFARKDDISQATGWRPTLISILNLN